MLNSPVAIVTGGGRGIGKGICLSLAQKNYSVVVNYRGSKEAAQQTAQECRDAGAPWAEAIFADVGALETHGPLIDQTIDATGRIDVLVNNAGISSPVRGDMLEVTSENWDTVLSTNLKGPFFLSQSVAARMIQLRQAKAIDRGCIINISSISAYVPSVARAEYCISKAGLSMLTQLLAHRLAEENIMVFEVRPGIIRSDMTKGVVEKYDRLIAEGLTAIRRWGTPEDVGNAVTSLASGAIPFSTGDTINVDGGFHSRHL